MFGNKADNLLKLYKEKFNVPEFIVIKHDDVVKGSINVGDLNNKSYDELVKISNKLKKEIETKLVIDFDLEFSSDLYAVRSSSNIEDGFNNSFAGQFETFLNVKKRDLKNKIIECFKSLYNVNVLEYLNKVGKSVDDLKMNVIIQKMVSSDLSGVLFTSNPQGLLNEIVIVVAEGLGENVVSDKGDTVSYYYNNNDKNYYYVGKRDLLSKQKIEELLELSNKLKKIFGDYLDVEFAIYEDKIYLLQTRSITTIDDSHLLIMDNSNIVESYPGISLPLTISFVNFVYSGVFKGVCGRILQNEDELNELNDVFGNMVGSVNGRIYYKISNWYTIIKYLPFSKKIIPVWQEMLGVSNKKYDDSDLKTSFGQKFRIYKNSFKELINVPKNMARLNKDFIEVNNYFYDKFNDDISPDELRELYNKIREKLLSCWDITLLNDLYTFIFTGLLKSRLKKKYSNNSEIANKYISGITNIESIKPIRELINIAYECKIDSDDYRERKKNYIKTYGDRNLEELKLESETFRTNDGIFDKRVKEYQKDFKHLKTMYENINKSDDEEIKEDKFTKFLKNKCTLGIRNREISRLNRSRIFGMVREIFLYYGEYFKNAKVITDKRDIFYLTIEEIFDNLKEMNSLKKVISERKKVYKYFEQLPAYSRLIFMNKEFDKISSDINVNEEVSTENVFYGIPCSNGIVEGKALVVEDINNLNEVKDKILITKMTDPGWVFLLATAKGVVSEKGSLLSHTAIISRELNIPSIVGVSNIMKAIKTDDIIRMDATTGKIEIIEKRR